MNTRTNWRSRAIYTSIALLLAGTIPVISADKGMAMKGPAMKASSDYRYELAAQPRVIGGGKSVVSVRLIHDGKPVTGAIIIQSRADMGPMGMASMTAPIKPLGEKPPGTYRFEISHGPVWKKPDDWALSLGAKVQGVMRTVNGSVTVKLVP